MPRLVLRMVARHFGNEPRVEALRGIDLDIPQNSYIAIEGESGGGKSTLLNILGLLDSPSTGSYLIGGVDAATLTERQAAERRSDTFAFVFQSFHLLERRPAVDSVELALHYRGVDAATRRLRALKALAAVGLENFAWTEARKLSGGQRQRVAIARALASGAPVVVADEPTGNLDSENSDAVIKSFQELRRHGVSLILVTHSEAVARHADRRVRVADGKITTDTWPAPTSNSDLDTPVANGTSVAGALTPTTDPVPPGKPSTVRLRAAIDDAWANVISRPARVLGLIAAIAISLALTVTTLGLTASANEQVSAKFNAVTSRDVQVQMTGDGVSPTLPWTLANTLQAIERLNGVESSALLVNGGASNISVGPPRQNLSSTKYSALGNVESALRLSVNWAPKSRGALAPNEVLVGELLAKRLELANVELKPTIIIGGSYFTVVGIIKQSPRAPDLLGKLITGSVGPSTIPVDPVEAYLVTRPGAAQQTAQEAPRAINPYRPDSLQVTAPVETNELRASIESSVASSLTILTAVALLASLASVIISTLVSVGERNAEIGLRRAMGARRRQISFMLIIESVIIGLLGSLVGLTLGMVSILSVTVFRRWTPVFDVSLGLIALAAGVTIACMGAVVGSIRAGRVVPSEALRA